MQQIRRATGLPISEALKLGLHSLRDRVKDDVTQRSPYDIYRDLDHGPGGSTIAPATESKRGVRAAIKKKLRR